jgi:pimeloyl-ACP methyl ester carboxylesterase
MAGDTAGLLDALHIDEAHFVGQSMGGVIAQYLTLNHPNRVLSLTLVYSTPSTDFIQGIDLLTGRLEAQPARNRDEAIELFVQNEAVSASPRYPRNLGWIRELGGLMHDRCYDPDGVRRQTEALRDSEDHPAPTTHHHTHNHHPRLRRPTHRPCSLHGVHTLISNSR